MQILIVEDESLVSKRIKRLTENILNDPQLRIICCSSVTGAKQFLAESTVDLLFLDLNLHGEDGFKLFNSMTKHIPTIIISAYKESAIEAFDHGVIDFVQKPIVQDRLEKALYRYFQVCALSTPRFLPCKIAGKIKNIDIDSINYIRAAGPYSEIILDDTSRVLMTKSLEKLEMALPPNLFKRIHKSHIVKVEAVKNLRILSGTKYQAELYNGELLNIGRTYYRAFKESIHLHLP
jgi:two-component system response regulator LytT